MTAKVTSNESERVQRSEIESIRKEWLLQKQRWYVEEINKGQREFELLQALACALPLIDVRMFDRTSIIITREQLPLVRAAVGRLRMVGKSLLDSWELSDEERRHGGDWIKVTMRPIAGDLKEFSFAYHLPYREGGTCKIVEEPLQQTTYRTLVCEK